MVSCFIGKSSQRKIPDFVFQRIQSEIIRFQSPNFLPDKKNQGIRITASIVHHLFRLPSHLRTSKWLVKAIKGQEPDLVVNFYEPLLGFSQWFWKLPMPIVSTAHQYMVLRKEFVFPKGWWSGRASLKMLTRISGIGSRKLLALSFYEVTSSHERNIEVVPPVLRQSVLDKTSKEGEFYLVYLLNQGYADAIESWHQKNRTVKLECFWDAPTSGNVYQPHPNLRFHQINDELFLEKMAECKALITTAGFESTCEAAFLGKPVMMVPVKNHYEQWLNANDAVRNGIGVMSKGFDIDKLMHQLKIARITAADQGWLKNGTEIIAKRLEAIVPNK